MTNQRYASVSVGFLVGCYVFLMVDVAAAFLESHSPFFPEEDYELALGTCEPTSRVILSQHPAVGSVSFDAQGVTLTLRMSTSEENPESYTAYIEERGESKLPVEVELPLESVVASLLPEKAICTDLNGDGKTDFITDHWLHGNGLGAAFSKRLVTLSSPSGGYRLWVLRTMYPSQADYVTFGSIEPIVFVTTSFANSGGAVPHSYLVYDLWTIRGDQVVSANHIDERFPKWIWMVFRENHKPASSLSREAKRRMREPRVAVEISVPD